MDKGFIEGADVSYHANPVNIVFMFNYRNFLLITRNAAGVWVFHYSIESVFDYLNSKGNNYNPKLPKDVWDVAEIFGYKLSELYEQCKKDYGDL